MKTTEITLCHSCKGEGVKQPDSRFLIKEQQVKVCQLCDGSGLLKRTTEVTVTSYKPPIYDKETN